MLSHDLKEKVLMFQRNEITEYNVYQKLARIVKTKGQPEILEKIAREELSHYEFFKSVSQQEVSPDQFKVFIYVFMSKVLGLNFGLRLMENGEQSAQDVYAQLKEKSLSIEKVAEDEKKHELMLLDMIDEERLKYISSIILGLNDALVELTATLAGFTLALQNTKLIGIVGLITGIAAAMSMAASEYLSVKNEGVDKNPVKASISTGLSYVFTVILLVMPYFLLNNIFVCLSLAIGSALLIILGFTFYISVAKNLDFRKRFLEMAGLSLGIATITFFIGMFVRNFFGVSV